MSFLIADQQENQVQGWEFNPEIDSLVFKGVGNKVKFGEGVKSKGCSIVFLGSNGALEVEEGCVIQGTFYIASNSNISIGSGTVFNKKSVFKAAGACSIQVGEDCLLANVQLVTADDLPVFDRITKKRINPADNIEICDRVWLAEYVTVRGGAKIGRDTVIGAWSTVMGVIPEHSIAAGSPAKVTKSDTVWKK
ncbi:MAG: hypothetical protein VXY56_07450 [Pseudomonadota bacterium]|nr:hypothetical protein [Pseudomonadota bacterium]